MSSHCADHIRVEHGRISSGRHRCDDIPGADRIAADAGLLETERSVLGHTDHGSLGSDISGPTAEDVANVILFFASDDSRAITGQVIVTDFGAML